MKCVPTSLTGLFLHGVSRDLFAKTMLQHNSLSAAGLLLMRWITIIHRRYYIFSALKVESTNLLRQLHELHTTRVIRGSHYSFQKNGMIAVAMLSFQQFATRCGQTASHTTVPARLHQQPGPLLDENCRQVHRHVHSLCLSYVQGYL